MHARLESRRGERLVEDEVSFEARGVGGVDWERAECALCVVGKHGAPERETEESASEQEEVNDGHV